MYYTVSCAAYFVLKGNSFCCDIRVQNKGTKLEKNAPAQTVSN